MNLTNTIVEALENTSRLVDAVVQEDIQKCESLLESRQQAMARFEFCHRNASPEERDSANALLDELIAADRTLQEASSIFRDRLGAEYRGLMSSGPHSRSAGYNAPPSQACLDRKA